MEKAQMRKNCLDLNKVKTSYNKPKQTASTEVR